MEVVVVAVVGFLIGGWSVPLGFLMGLSPEVTLVAAARGGLSGCSAFILAGDRVKAWGIALTGQETPSLRLLPDGSLSQKNIARVMGVPRRFTARDAGLLPRPFSYDETSVDDLVDVA